MNFLQNWKAWLPVLSLSFAGFIFVTTEMIPVGLLPDISQGLGSTEASTGLLVTVYAWVVAVTALPLTVLTAKSNRRKLMLWLLGTFILSHVFAAFAHSYGMLMGARICIALAHAIFWAITTPMAVRLAPEGKKGQAIAIIVTGVSLATVLGVPLGTLVGKYLGWRMTFALIGAVAVVIFAIIYRLLPSMPSHNAGSLKSLPVLMRSVPLLRNYALIALTVAGHFTAFTYLRPFMEQLAGFDSSLVIGLLLIVGLSGIAGSYIAGFCAERYPGPILVLPLVLMFGCLTLLVAASATLWTTVVLCVVWGVSMSAVCLVFQLRTMSIAHNSVDVALAIGSGIFNIGIGGGALMGSKVFVHMGLENVGYAGAGFIGAAVLVALTALTWSARKTKPVQEAPERVPSTQAAEAGTAV